LIDIHSLLDREFNKLSNASNRAKFRVTVHKLWPKQNSAIFHNSRFLARALARARDSELCGGRIVIKAVKTYFSKMVGFFESSNHPIAFFDWNRARKHDGAIKRMIRG
jgi:hypothetical protein